MVPSRWRFWPVRDSRNGELGSPPPCTTRQVARRRVLYRDTNTVRGRQPVPEGGTGQPVSGATFLILEVLRARVGQVGSRSGR